MLLPKIPLVSRAHNETNQHCMQWRRLQAQEMRELVPLHVHATFTYESPYKQLFVSFNIKNSKLREKQYYQCCMLGYWSEEQGWERVLGQCVVFSLISLKKPKEGRWGWVPLWSCMLAFACKFVRKEKVKSEDCFLIYEPFSSLFLAPIGFFDWS